MAHCFRFTKDNYLNFCEEFMKISKGSKNEPIAKEENFAKLQHFAVLCNTMDLYSHADSTPSKEDTEKFISTLIDFFNIYPSAVAMVNELKKWLLHHSGNVKVSERAPTSMGQFLQRFLVAWEIGWEENKVKLIQQADFDSIVNPNSV